MTPPCIRFTQRIASSSELIIGELTIYSAPHRGLILPAVSGARNHQHTFAHPGLSPLPPSVLVQVPYELSLRPIASQKQGIRGWFFPILPHTVRSKFLPAESQYGLIRDNFGLHFDADAPGTGGCIGPQDKRDWAQIIAELMIIGETRQTVPLEVIHMKE